MNQAGQKALSGLVRAFFWKVRMLPRPLAHSYCRLLAAVVHGVDRKHRRIGEINLKIAFPDRSETWRRRVLRGSYLQLGDLAVEVSRLGDLRREDLAKRVEYEPGRGLENYLAARAEGKGVLFVTAHVSAWELLPAAHALFGHPLSFIVRPLDNPFLEDWVTFIREASGNSVVAKRGSLLRVSRQLRLGRDVGILIDQNVQQREGVYAPLLGRPACTTAGPALLALKWDVPVLPGFIRPGKRLGHYRIRFYPPLRPIRTGDLQEEMRVNTEVYNRHVEEMIREFPHCWLWGHRRFRSQPDGSDPYQGI